MARFALTTIDNPFDPFKEFELWNAFDQAKDYNSSSLLARIVESSNELPESLQEEAIEEAIDSIVAESPLLIYKKVENKDFKPEKN